MKDLIKRAGRLTAIVLAALVLLVPAAAPDRASYAGENTVKPYVSSFSDVYGTPFYKAVSELAEAGIINGYEDGTYGPYNTLTRAEACTLMYKAYCDDSVSPYTGHHFTDLRDPSYWGYKYISYCAAVGIVSGYPDGSFKPDNKVTYNELICMIVRARGLNNGQILSWPTGWIDVARADGMLDKLSGVYIGDSNSKNANRGNTAIMIASGSEYNSISADDPTEDYFADRNMTGVAYGIVTETRADSDSTGNSCVIARLLLGDRSYDIVPDPSLPYLFSGMTPASGLIRVVVNNGRATSALKVTPDYSGTYGMLTPSDSSSGMTAFSRINSISKNSLSYSGSSSGTVKISSNAVFYRVGMNDGKLSAYRISPSDAASGGMAAAYSVNGAAGTAAEVIITVQPEDFDDVLHSSSNPNFRLMG